VSSLCFVYIWHAVAAWAAAFSSRLQTTRVPKIDASWASIIDRAVESGDEHAIKFTEACRRLEGRHPSPVFRAAADDWISRLAENRDWSPVELVEAGIRTRLSSE